MSSVDRRRALASLQGAAGLVSVAAVLRAQGQAQGPAQGPKVWVEGCWLFKKRPDAISLAVPRMPLGSPGMDGPADDNRQDPCDVLLIARDGSTQVFNNHFKQKGTFMNHQQCFFRAAGLALVLSAAALSPAWAASHQGTHGAHGDHGKQTAQTATDDMTDGEVRKVDKEGGKLTLKHADIKSLDMPAMTMVFVVKDKAMLDKLKAGDKIKFKAINDAGKYTVTEMQMAQ